MKGHTLLLVLILTVSCLMITSTCMPSYSLDFAYINNTLSFKQGSHIRIENIKEGDVLSYGFFYSFLFVREETLKQLNIQSFKQFITSGNSKIIGVDSAMLSLWLDILDFYSIELTNWETFEFYSTYCSPNEPFKKYDIMFTSNDVFFKAHFYDSGRHLFHFVPVKVFPYSFRTKEMYPSMTKYTSSTDRQQDYMNLNLFMYFRYGNLSEEDISFIKFYSKVDNVTVDYNNFKSMMENASSHFQIDFFGIKSTTSDYLQNTKLFELSAYFISEDYWNYPSLALIVLYFLFLFASRLFLKPALKIRLFIPYFPILALIQEVGISNYIFYYCSEYIGYLRIFIFCFVCFSYGFTVMRIYYLRNIYSIMFKNQSLDEHQIKRMKFLTTKKFAFLVIPGLSFILSILLTLQCIAIFFEIESSTRYLVTNISFPIYPILGIFIGVCVVVIDIKMNWKYIREKGLRKFLLFDDPFNVRIDLILMSLMLIFIVTIVILNVLVFGHANRVLNWCAYLIFTLICGGSTLIKELVIAIRKDKSPKSELEKLLENQSFRELFKEYCTKEMSLENFMFYEKLRDLISKFGMNGYIPNNTLQELESQFFSQESPFELNIPSKTRKLFYALFDIHEKPTGSSSTIELLESNNHSTINTTHTKVSDLYTIIYNDLYTNMSDTHSRFLETDEFKNWYSVFNIQRKQSLIIV